MWLMRMSWRALRRDLRSGELRLLAAALTVAVAAVACVGFLADRVHRALENTSHELLAADLRLSSDHPWPGDVAAAARREGLAVAATDAFLSMVTGADAEGAQLTAIKVVSDAYPLRGQLLVSADVTNESAAAKAPPPGTVWCDERLTALLHLSVGGTVKVGERRLHVGGVLTAEPDRGMNFLNLAPRLMMNLADLEGSGLIGVGSRVTYDLLVAGD